jgi:hypothetical protein
MFSPFIRGYGDRRHAHLPRAYRDDYQPLSCSLNKDAKVNKTGTLLELHSAKLAFKARQQSRGLACRASASDAACHHPYTQKRLE